MKILLTVHQFFPDFSSGTEVLTLEVTKELKRLGHDVHVFTGYPESRQLNDNERFDHYIYDGIPVERFRHAYQQMGKQKDVFTAEYDNQFFADYFRSYLQSLQPQIVHFFHLHRLSASAIDVCTELNIPCVCTPTDFWLICPLNQLRLPDNSLCKGPSSNRVNCLRHVDSFFDHPGRKSRLVKLPDWLLAAIIWFNRLPVIPENILPFMRAVTSRVDFMVKRMNMLDRVLVPTRLMMELLIRNGLKPHKALYCPFGLNLAYSKRQTKTAHAPPLKVGYIGTLGEHKGVHLLVEAIRSLPQAALQLKIYGKMDDFPEYVDSLKKIAADDPRISFCGTFPNDQIGEVFANIDVLVVPSIWYENTPLVIYSAQAAGCPVIATNLGGMSEVVINEENGLLFEVGDVEGLAIALKRLIEDAGLLESLSIKSKMPKSISEYVAEIYLEYSRLVKSS